MIAFISIQEGDLFTAEVQQIYQDGTLALQTRSLRYGKLGEGILVHVRSSLINIQKIIFIVYHVVHLLYEVVMVLYGYVHQHLHHPIITLLIQVVT